MKYRSKFNTRWYQIARTLCYWSSQSCLHNNCIPIINQTLNSCANLPCANQLAYLLKDPYKQTLWYDQLIVKIPDCLKDLIVGPVPVSNSFWLNQLGLCYQHKHDKVICTLVATESPKLLTNFHIPCVILMVEQLKCTRTFAMTLERSARPARA